MRASDPDPVDAPARVRRIAFALWGDTLQTTVQEGPANPQRRAVLTRDAHTAPVLHLPPGADAAGDVPLAMAAHAAAHLRFGGPPQVRSGLRPVQQALFDTLEDARVEWLALQELPGLRAIWWPFHADAAAWEGTGFEHLLARLGASLLTPARVPAHAWVERVRRSFFAADGHTLAVQTPSEVRTLASVLGHDIGQMRLPFQARTYGVHARYRDDNTHLWLPEHTPPSSDWPLAADVDPDPDPATGEAGAAPLAAPGRPDAVHAEWDHRIGRYRAGWCSVYQVAPPTGPAAWEPGALSQGEHALVRRLAGTCGPWRHGSGRSTEGDVLHTAALVDCALDLRHQRTPDPRIHRRPRRVSPPLAVLLLLDASASTARASAPGTGPAGDCLLRLQRSAATASQALQRLGHRSTLWTFSSQGRHRVELACLQPWDAPLTTLPRLQGGGSTRLGAALRQALTLQRQDAQQRPGFRRVVVVLTDGELHDIDVHDPGYLPADLGQAAREAAAQRICVRAVVLEPGTAGALAAALGPGHVRSCAAGTRLDQVLGAVLADVCRTGA